MRTVYVDSSAFIALLRRADAYHAAAAGHFTRLRRRGALLVTCDPVIAETSTRLRYDAGPAAVTAFREGLEDAAAAGQLRVRESDTDLRVAALELIASSPRLRLSYADAVGATVAREVTADAVFAFDTDFRDLGFRLEPTGQ